MAAATGIDIARPGTAEIANLLAALSYDRTALSRMMGGPRWRITATTDTNTAAASSPIASLSDLGVTFPASSERDIILAVTAFNGANRYRFVTKQRVLGGTNPTLKGNEQYLTSNRALLVGTVATGAVTEVAAECLRPEWWDGDAPVAGDFGTGDSVIQWLGANSPVRALTPLGAVIGAASAGIGSAIPVDHVVTSLANGTSTLRTGTINGTEALADPPDGRIVAEALLYPPVHCPVLIDAAATPDEVIIGTLGLSSDVVNWIVDVFVGDLVESILA